MPNSLKILLVEDDWSVRSAIKNYLVKHDFVIAEAASLEASLVTAGEFQPDVAGIDIVLPEQDGGRADFGQHTGIDIARRLREHLPQVGIVFLSAYFDRGSEVARMVMNGHDRIVYLLKGSRPVELLNAIQKVAQGTAALEIASGVQTQRKSLSQRIMETLSQTERACVQVALGSIPALTDPELRVFEAIGSCQTRQQAAENLSLSAKTVSSHMDSIYAKLYLNGLEAGLNPLPLLAKIHLLYRLQQIPGEPLQ
jgi:DNA-binding NarL/FixJ family response regulator